MIASLSNPRSYNGLSCRSMPVEKPVSAMRIKAIGTVKENLGDGKTVRVDWEPLPSPRDWYFYTYRTTLNEADPGDLLARYLILFAFGNAPQDYQFWLGQPYFATKYGKASKETPLELEDEHEAISEGETPPSYTVDQYRWRWLLSSAFDDRHHS